MTSRFEIANERTNDATTNEAKLIESASEDESDDSEFQPYTQRHSLRCIEEASNHGNLNDSEQNEDPLTEGNENANISVSNEPHSITNDNFHRDLPNELDNEDEISQPSGRVLDFFVELDSTRENERKRKSIAAAECTQSKNCVPNFYVYFGNWRHVEESFFAIAFEDCEYQSSIKLLDGAVLRVASIVKPDSALQIVSGIYPTIRFATGSHNEIFGPNGTGEQSILDCLIAEIGNLSSATDDHVNTLPINRDDNLFEDKIDDSDFISKFIFNADHIVKRELARQFVSMEELLSKLDFDGTGGTNGLVVKNNDLNINWDTGSMKKKVKPFYCDYEDCYLFDHMFASREEYNVHLKNHWHDVCKQSGPLQKRLYFGDHNYIDTIQCDSCPEMFPERYIKHLQSTECKYRKQNFPTVARELYNAFTANAYVDDARYVTPEHFCNEIFGASG